MAECPNCKQKLHFRNVKAECPHCGANIHNHNWEERLDEDAKLREEAYFKMNTKLHKLKFATIGTPLRIARLVLSVLPIVGFVLPLAALTLGAPSGSGDPIAINNFSVISLFTSDFGIKQLLEMPSQEGLKTAGIFGLVSVGLLALSLLFGVIAFFITPILFNKPKSPVQAVLHCISTVLYASFPFAFARFAAEYTASGLAPAETSTGWGIFVGILLFLIVFVVDIIIAVKSIDEKAWKYIPKDELQLEYAISIGAVSADEIPTENKETAESVEK